MSFIEKKLNQVPLSDFLIVWGHFLTKDGFCDFFRLFALVPLHFVETCPFYAKKNVFGKTGSWWKCFCVPTMSRNGQFEYFFNFFSVKLYTLR